MRKTYTVQYFDADIGWETVTDIGPVFDKFEAEEEEKNFKNGMPYRIKTKIVCE